MILARLGPSRPIRRPSSSCLSSVSPPTHSSQLLSPSHSLSTITPSRSSWTLHSPLPYIGCVNIIRRGAFHSSLAVTAELHYGDKELRKVTTVPLATVLFSAPAVHITAAVRLRDGLTTPTLSRFTSTTCTTDHSIVRLHPSRGSRDNSPCVHSSPLRSETSSICPRIDCFQPVTTLR